MKNKKLLITRITMCTLTALAVIFIFTNSLVDAPQSTVQSGKILEIVNSLLASLKIDFVFTQHVIRKCAHFAEFFVLGGLLFYTVKSFVSKTARSFLLACGIGLVVALMDETLQLFSTGRSAQISDVFIDFSGVLIANVIFTLITVISKNIRKRKLKNE